MPVPDILQCRLAQEERTQNSNHEFAFPFWR